MALRSRRVPLLTTILLIAAISCCYGRQETQTVKTGGSSRPATPEATRQPGYPFPPYLEADRSYPADPPCSLEFVPDQGGLPMLRKEAAARTCGICVNLARGDAACLPDADFMLRSPTGSDARFQRCFRTDRARVGYGSPGLSPGWVHNYDVVIVNAQTGSNSSRWQPLKLVYPNGEHDLLRPELTSDGQPTGRLLTADRMPFTAAAKPRDLPGRWQSITLKWRNNATWSFVPYDSNSFLLDQVDTLTLDWDEARRLLSVIDVTTHDHMLTLRYDIHGHLASVTDRNGRFRRYRFDVPLKNSKRPAKLVSVSQPMPPGVVRIVPGAQYAYSTASPCELLWHIREFGEEGQGDRNCYIRYGDDRVVSIRDVIGLDHLFTYRGAMTRITLEDADRKVVDFWIQHLDEYGRNTGTTDAQGRGTAIHYD